MREALISLRWFITSCEERGRKYGSKGAVDRFMTHAEMLRGRLKDLTSDEYHNLGLLLDRSIIEIKEQEEKE